MRQFSIKQTAQAIVELIADSRLGQKALAERIAGYLIETRQTGALNAIMREVTRQREAKGFFEATITTARSLPAELKSAVKKVLPPRTTINEVIDPDLLGGIKIEQGEMLIEASLQRELKDLRYAVKDSNGSNV
jgi:F-type H+-transporting ATPase subunit delta